MKTRTARSVIEAFDKAELLALLTPPPTASIWVAAINHADNSTVFAHRTKSGLTAMVSSYCTEYWHDVFDGETLPGLQDVIGAYFDFSDENLTCFEEVETNPLHGNWVWIGVVIEPCDCFVFAGDSVTDIWNKLAAHGRAWAANNGKKLPENKQAAIDAYLAESGSYTSVWRRVPLNQ